MSAPTLPMKTKLEIIDETVQYYSEDVSRRAQEFGTCNYMDDAGNRCAVGRCLAEEHIYDAADIEGPVRDLIIELGVADIDEVLSREYQGHDMFFWDDLQHLHDHEGYWKVGGLTAKGEDWVERMKDKYRNWQ